MTTHSGCVWDFPLDVALVHAEVRGIKLVLASLRDDEADTEAVLDEIGDCVECLRHMCRLLSGMAAGIGESLTAVVGKDRSAGIRQLEKQLAEAIGKLH